MRPDSNCWKFLKGRFFQPERLSSNTKKGEKTAPLPDFFIGAHAEILNIDLLTRDVSRYKPYFPTVKLIAP
uniref:PIN domain-containing protein n=1 Tax=uncultured Desulfobacterium sp. TaxID=201089 RepID=E1YAQ7_9BACT|nr:hypothetical protein N47_H24730 [uncultured Desulfobacterium sp.]